jgi:hypothetical protein
VASDAKPALQLADVSLVLMLNSTLPMVNAYVPKVFTWIPQLKPV